MRTHCERCQTALGWESTALICSHECTFCEACVAEMRGVCPNCAGELVPRPRRALVAEAAPVAPAALAGW